MTEAEHYANEVLAGRIVAGRLIRLACKRFLNDLKRTDIYFDEKEANKFIFFAENHLCQWEGDFEGVPVKFELWQKFVFQQLFGWVKLSTGTRRFTKFYLQISKKNGKSSMCAWLSLFHLFADERVKTPKVFTAANNEDQAKICVNMAGQTTKFSPDLCEFVDDGRVKLSTYGKNITEVIHKERNGFITALSKEGGDKTAKTSGGKHGINASLGLVDEFAMSPDHGASGSISTSMVSRKERLMAYLTTSGYNKDGPCYKELREQGIKLLEGTITLDNYLPIIFEIDKPKDDKGKEKDITLQWLLEHQEEWIKSNPNLGVSVNVEALIADVQSAIDLGGSTEVDTLTLNFNIWTDSPQVFVPSEVWASNTHGLKESDLLGRPCFGGIELVGAKGMSAFCLLFPMEKLTAIKMYFWGPGDYFKNNSDRFDRYNDWQEFIKLDPGNTVENEVIIDWLEEEIGKYNMKSFAFPKIKENDDIVQGLIKDGIEGEPISQAVGGIGNPTSQWEDLLTAGTVEHFNNPVLTWMNSNCNVIRKEAGIRIEKQGSRVVGISACINAVAQWKSDIPEPPSVYSTRGVLVID
jgi:phage terminase large subunit-like protein